METFKTLIKKEHENHSRWNSENDYVVGRVSGISLVLCGSPREAYELTNDGVVLTVTCEPEAYEHFMCIVEKQYPKMCEFYYGKES